MLVDILGNMFGILTIIGQVVALALFVMFIFRKKLHHTKLFKIIESNALALGLILAIVATGGSLTYSELIGFTPCVLCWWQRIFHYPLIILFLISLIRQRDWTVKFYALPLAIIGAGIAGFHYIIQRFQVESLACDALGQSPSCAGYYVFEFGYITIPMMSLTIFLLIIVLMLFVREK